MSRPPRTSYSNGKPNLEIPLSPTAWNALESLARGEFPAQQVNPGVVSKLVSHGLATSVQRPSPYASHKPGTQVAFLQITDKGREELEARAQNGVKPR